MRVRGRGPERAALSRPMQSMGRARMKEFPGDLVDSWSSSAWRISQRSAPDGRGVRVLRPAQWSGHFLCGAKDAPVCWSGVPRWPRPLGPHIKGGTACDKWVECNGKWRCPDGFHHACEPVPNKLGCSRFASRWYHIVLGKAVFSHHRTGGQCSSESSSFGCATRACCAACGKPVTGR